MIGKAWVLIRDTVSGFIEHEDLSRGAAIAYYTIFSIAPLLIIVIAIAGLVFGHDAAQGAIVAQLRGLIGKQSAEILQSMIQSASQKTTGVLATVIGVGTLLVTSTGAFAEIQSALNAIWKASPSVGFSALIRSRLMSLGLVFTLGFLMLVSLVVSAALTALGDYLSGLFPGAGFLMSLLNCTISLLLISALFAAIYKILPDTPIAWRDVAVGSVATAILFTVGKSLIGLYIGSTSVASSYGAAGALLIILLWVYYSTQIFLLGAEYTRAYAQNHGSLSPRESSARTPTCRRIEPRDSVR
jgi:membrane protein